MRSNKKHVFVAAALFGLWGLGLTVNPGICVAADPPPHIKLLPAGDPAPEFEAVDIEGKPFALKEELAKGPVLLVFWSIF